MRKKTDPDAKQDEKLTGAWLHLANGRKRPLEKAHWCTKRKTRPESAFWAPKVWKHFRNMDHGLYSIMMI